MPLLLVIYIYGFFSAGETQISCTKTNREPSKLSTCSIRDLSFAKPDQITFGQTLNQHSWLGKNQTGNEDGHPFFQKMQIFPTAMLDYEDVAKGPWVIISWGSKTKCIKNISG